MALIKCPECKKSISDASVRCPFCDFILINKVVEERNVPTNKCQTNQNSSAKQVLKILRFTWLFNFIDNIADNLSYIPIVGPLLSFVLKWVCAVALVAIVVGVIDAIMGGFYYISPLCGIEAILICSTIGLFFHNYRKRNRPYYFWMALVLTILCPIVFTFV